MLCRPAGRAARARPAGRVALVNYTANERHLARPRQRRSAEHAGRAADRLEPGSGSPCMGELRRRRCRSEDSNWCMSGTSHQPRPPQGTQPLNQMLVDTWQPSHTQSRLPQSLQTLRSSLVLDCHLTVAIERRPQLSGATETDLNYR